MTGVKDKLRYIKDKLKIKSFSSGVYCTSVGFFAVENIAKFDKHSSVYDYFVD